MKKMKLNDMERRMLEKREMDSVRGKGVDPNDGYCGCGCAYANQGGSSDLDNAAANSILGLFTGTKIIMPRAAIVVGDKLDDNTRVNP